MGAYSRPTFGSDRGCDVGAMVGGLGSRDR